MLADRRQKIPTLNSEEWGTWNILSYMRVRRARIGCAIRHTGQFFFHVNATGRKSFFAVAHL
jgi:hypothetical protein